MVEVIQNKFLHINWRQSEQSDFRKLSKYFYFVVISRSVGLGGLSTEKKEENNFLLCNRNVLSDRSDGLK